MKKQFISLFTAAITVLSISTSAMATSFEKEPSIQVGSTIGYTMSEI